MKCVFTNGVFDILHVGHIRLLEYAKSFGDLLIVGINSDDSTRRLKGNTRPIQNEKDRYEILSALEAIDRVIIFEEDTPEILIKYFRPEVLIKGPEEKEKIIPGADFVKSYGGEIIIPDWELTHSTTKIINKIRLLNRKQPCKSQ